MLPLLTQWVLAFASLTSLCRDLDERCPEWQASGECENNLGFMKLHACRMTCGSCALDAADVSPLRSDENESVVMRAREHGTCVRSPRSSLRWGADRSLASEIGCFNRRGAEQSGYWLGTALERYARGLPPDSRITFYDAITSRPLFVAPVNRTMEDFLEESKAHGWPSFRDEEVVAENLRVLRGTAGEVVSIDGTHLGHNLPDQRNRYCINLVSVAGIAKHLSKADR
jgi:hypothetical protein